MKLNLGCGTRNMSEYGFINVDARIDLDNPDPRCRCNPDIVDDVAKLTKFSDNSVDLIYNCHLFEHFMRNDRHNVLKRWFEVLKPGGILRMAVPDFEAVAYAYLNKIVPFEKLWSSLNGSQRHLYDIHYHCYDLEHLKSDLESVGFTDVNRYDWRKTEHWECDDYSQAYYPFMDKENGFLLSLNVEATKP